MPKKEEKSGLIRLAFKFGNNDSRKRLSDRGQRGSQPDRKTGQHHKIDLMLTVQGQAGDDLHQHQRRNDGGNNAGEKAQDNYYQESE